MANGKIAGADEDGRYTLAVDRMEDVDGWSVGWATEDDGIQVWLGELLNDARSGKLKQTTDADTRAAELAVQMIAQSLGAVRATIRDTDHVGAWVFKSKADAISARQLANLAVKEALAVRKLAEKPAKAAIPKPEEWEVKAIAAGWTPPSKDP